MHSIWQTLIEKLLADEALPVTIDKIAGPVLPWPKSTYTETKFNFETCILNFLNENVTFLGVLNRCKILLKMTSIKTLILHLLEGRGVGRHEAHSNAYSWQSFNCI